MIQRVLEQSYACYYMLFIVFIPTINLVQNPTISTDLRFDSAYPPRLPVGTASRNEG